MSSAAADQDLSIVQIPKVSRYWRSRLEDGPRRTYGRWLPGTSNQKPMLDCIPCQTEKDKTIYTVSFSTTVPDAAPVMAGKRSIINFKSRLDRPADLYVGMTMKTAEGNFAGRFQVVLPSSEFQSGAAFNYSIEVEDFTLDPSLSTMKNDPDTSTDQLIVESMWLHTLYQQAGRAVTSVELTEKTE